MSAALLMWGRSSELRMGVDASMFIYVESRRIRPIITGWKKQL
jgi:hypothetical protein